MGAAEGKRVDLRIEELAQDPQVVVVKTGDSCVDCYRFFHVGTFDDVADVNDVSMEFVVIVG